MGRKTQKGKERKAAWKEEQARLAAAQKLVDQANALEDPLARFPIFHKYDRNGICCQLECKKVTKLDPEAKEWIFDLCKRNMETLYEESEWGWRDLEKRKQMMEDAAMYLIARDEATRKPVAFSHFRFDMDYGDEVLYCYEVQLEEEVRGKGLGRFFMQVLELMAFTNQMLKVVLTVFKHNPQAQNFFRKCRYEVDETSPEDSIEEQFHYQILSKYNKMKPIKKVLE